MDIADIKVGMEAEIKLKVYPYNKYGNVKRKVKYISSSLFNSKQLGSVYLVKLNVDNSNPNILASIAKCPIDFEIKFVRQGVTRKTGCRPSRICDAGWRNFSRKIWIFCNRGKYINVMSDFSGSVEVKIGKQSVMRYLLNPIVKGFGEILKEK